MSDLGNDVAQFLLANPVLWPLYLAGFWFFVVRPLFRSRTGRPVAADASPAAGASVAEPFDEAPYRELLARSFEAYRDGACDAYLEPAYVESVRSADPDKLVRNALALTGTTLRAAFAEQPPRPGEILLGASAGGSVVTNQRLILLNGHGFERAIELVSIKSYLESGIRARHISIILKGGEPIERDGGIALAGPAMQALIERANRRPPAAT